jgi:hypothetical protein
MEKDMLAMSLQIARRKYEKILLPSKQKLPKIIALYKQDSSKNLVAELMIVEDYYKSLIFFEQILKEFIEKFEDYEVDEIVKKGGDIR